MNHKNNSILILGKPKSGKTTYLAQLYRRVSKNKSKIKWWKTPENIKAIEDAVKRLSKGIEPQSTPADVNEILKLPIRLENKEFELLCPDYGGEQIKSMIELMEYNQEWTNMATSSNNIILFIRPSSIFNYYDLSNSGYESLTKIKSEGNLISPLSEQCQLIELLQIILFLRRKSNIKLSYTNIVVALTCWDEINTEYAPVEYLKSIMPLLFSFLKSNWENDFKAVYGLSSQGFSLATEDAKIKYLEELPENFGYIVGDSKIPNNDITTLLDITTL